MNKSISNFRSMALLLLFMSALLFSCQKDDVPETIEPPIDDNSLPSGAIVNTQLLEKKENTIRFKMDIAVFKDSRNIEKQLKMEQFIIDTLLKSGTNAFKCAKFSLSGSKNLTNYSALMLMDQSGSISGTDPKDYRLDAAKTFCANLGNGNNTVLWSFASNSYTKHGSDFTNDTASVISQIESLRNKEGGGTPLHKSQMAAIDYCSTNATAQGKAVLSFTDGQDNGGGFTPSQVAANAIAKNVRLYNIGLGDAEILTLSNQAVNTGGAFMFAKNARQLISMFGNLGKLLDGSATFYQTEWQITKSTIFTSGTIQHEVRILLPYGESELKIPFTITY